ncbi:hypothetical protein [Paenibacillus antarcticus]|nr:hypothetical protein [Paenibacillus antarcticus]
MFKNISFIFGLLLVMLAIMITACGSKGAQSSESNKSSEEGKVEEVVSE